VLRQLLCGCLCAGSLVAGTLPGWWLAFPKHPRLESAFKQESESAVFGKLRRKGTLRLAQGGRLRVEYTKGMVLVADGRTLVQYDPEARTAQRVNLRSAAGDAPLLNILLNPRTLDGAFKATAGPEGDVVTLEPRKAGVPSVVIEGQGLFLKRIRWTDATGAKQVIELLDPHVPAALDPALFTFKAPAGTRWLETR
jgi:outer membrane lipoprotein-sorting protein